MAGGAAAAENQDRSLDSAELYDPTADRWLPAPNMPTAHAGAAAGLLGDGTVIVAGGLDFQGGFGIPVQAADLYDPGRNSWEAVAPLQVARGQPGATLLGDGSLLVVGGFGRTGARSESTAEDFDPATRRWTLLPRLPETRISPTVTALAGNRALVVGGTRQQAAEVFTPAAAARAPPWTLAQAAADNRPLLVLTLLLLVAVAGQAGWRRSRAG